MRRSVRLIQPTPVERIRCPKTGRSAVLVVVSILIAVCTIATILAQPARDLVEPDRSVFQVFSVRNRTVRPIELLAHAKELKFTSAPKKRALPRVLAKPATESDAFRPLSHSPVSRLPAAVVADPPKPQGDLTGHVCDYSFLLDASPPVVTEKTWVQSSFGEDAILRARIQRCAAAVLSEQSLSTHRGECAGLGTHSWRIVQHHP